MEKVAPVGPVYQAGTLSGNPLSVCAGIAALSFLISDRHRIYERLNLLTERLCAGIEQAASEAGIPCQVNRVCSMFTIFFASQKVRDMETAMKCNTAMFSKFHASMLQKGIFLPPSQFEACFLSIAHTEKEIDLALEAIRKSLREL